MLSQCKERFSVLPTAFGTNDRSLSTALVGSGSHAYCQTNTEEWPTDDIKTVSALTARLSVLPTDPS